jgi:ribonuclease P protein component
VRALSQKSEYHTVYDRGRTWAGHPLVIKALPNARDYSRFGFSVGKTVGKAVVRNKVRRRLKEIARLAPVEPGWDIVIIARADCANSDYARLRRAFEKTLIRAKLIAENDETSSAGIN